MIKIIDQEWIQKCEEIFLAVKINPYKILRRYSLIELSMLNT